MKALFQKATLPFLLTTFAFLVFIFAFLFILLMLPHTSYLFSLYFLIPVLIFSAITILTYKNKIKKIVLFILCIVLSALFVYFTINSTLYLIFYECTYVTTDIKQYKITMKNYGYPHNEFLSHFPESIPDHALNIHFYEEPKFMQNRSSIFLLFDTTVDDVLYYKSIYSDKAINLHAENKSNYCLPEVFQEAIGYNILPDDFEIYVLGSNPSELGDWNHGYSYGIAVSEKRRQILFYRQIW